MMLLKFSIKGHTMHTCTLTPAAVLTLDLYNSLVNGDNESFIMQSDCIIFKTNGVEYKFYYTELKLYQLRSLFRIYDVTDHHSDIDTLFDIYHAEKKRIPEFFYTADKEVNLWEYAFDLLLHSTFRTHIYKKLVSSIKNNTIDDFKKTLVSNSFTLPYSGIIKYDQYMMCKCDHILESTLTYSDCSAIAYWLLESKEVRIKYMKEPNVLPRGILVEGNNIVNVNGDGIFTNHYLIKDNYVIYV